jgi:hypothetical protein
MNLGSLFEIFQTQAQALGYRSLAQRGAARLAQDLLEIPIAHADTLFASPISRRADSMRETRPFSRATMRSICFLFSRSSWRASSSSCFSSATCDFAFFLVLSDWPCLAVLSSNFSRSL